MQNNVSEIVLVNLGSRIRINTIAKLFEQLEVIFKIIDSLSWLNKAKHEQNNLIVLILPEQTIGDEISKTILASVKSHHFAIFFSPLNNDLIRILDLCTDCCAWPCDPQELSFRLNRFSSIYCGLSELNNLDSDTMAWRNLSLVGQSPEFINTLSFIKNASNCDAPVLLESQTGCGKDVTARAIHYLGGRKGFPFIPMNCGAIPDQLIENELFGHEKGAYTDAKQSQSGLAAQADGGTLFLDEIEALSPKGQVTLLRFIEDNIIRPLGSTKCKKVDVRIIAASNICLSDLVAKGQFRQDLLFRLNLLHIHLPPLRNRIQDIQLLAEHFIEKYRHQYRQPDKRIDPRTLAWMQEYHWPGNVRELENFVHRSFLLSEGSDIISTGIIHDEQQAYSRRKLFDRRQKFTFDAPFNEAKNHAINHFEQTYLTWLITNSNGNVTQAADKAQKERRSLGKLLKKHAIRPFHFRDS